MTHTPYAVLGTEAACCHQPPQAVLRERPRGTLPASSQQAAADLDDPQPVEFKDGARVVFLGHDNYGCVGTVVPDRNKSIGRGAAKVPPASRRYCLRVQPLPPGAENAVRVAKRIMQQYQVRTAPLPGAACCLLLLQQRLHENC